MKRIQSWKYWVGVGLTVVLAGCATQPGVNQSLQTIDQGLSNLEGAAQTSRQVIGAANTTGQTMTNNQVALVDILVRQLGVTPHQALGGAGAILQAAQGNMSPQAFATLSQSVPGMNNMLSAAPQVGNLSALMGGSNQTLGTMASLATSFQQLDLSADMVGRFIPIVTQYVSQTSGQLTANLLQNALTAR